MGTAGGKVILCGEHAVVHGGDALVVGLHAGVTATARVAGDWSITINGAHLSPTDPTLEALRRVGGHLDSGPVAVTLDVTMPLGVGLGGSAAMAVAIARAIAERFGYPLSDRQAFNAAQVWERVFHGNPSGVDAAAATHGGCLLYNRHVFADEVLAREGPPPRVTSSLPLHLALAVAGPPSLTKSMVEQVAGYKAHDPSAFDEALRAIQNIVVEAQGCLEQGDLPRLGSLMTLNHGVLSQWQLSTARIDAACTLAVQYGALGAKLTGAGGGGCVVALCTHETLTQVLAAWAEANYPTLSAIVPPSRTH